MWDRWSAVQILIWVTAPMSKRSKSANKVLRDWQTLTAEPQRSKRSFCGFGKNEQA
ncbi:hypothetical protein [Congzhengia minquanensis]|uniref:Uncharacterized protein n=1 Tax=Congzhengia minquanensis TaxID=2763657 RepID=A0A926HZ00_9FIRM|nr:hypothetical protein [Congzhengia minquanensis]MBC8541639.1 hypothetical protein [Congzhengia minquanensis]